MADPALFPVVFLLGVLLTLRGMLGRRAGSHPICRKCGYDLFGSRGTVCPECHTDGARRAPFRGERVRFRGVMYVGLAMLIVGVVGTIPHAKAINYYRFAPLATLIGAANIGLTGAVDELKSRIEAETLSPQEYDELATRALKIQRDDPIEAVYFKGWMDVLTQLHLFSKLNPEQVSQMNAQLIRNIVVEPRMVVRRGDILPVRVRVNVTIEGTPVDWYFDRVTVDDENVYPFSVDRALMRWSPRFAPGLTVENPTYYELLFPFAEPRAILEIDVRAEVGNRYIASVNQRRSLLRLYADMLNTDPGMLEQLNSEENSRYFNTMQISLEKIIAFAKNPHDISDPAALFNGHRFEIRVVDVDAVDDVKLVKSTVVDQQVRGALIARGLFTQVVRPTGGDWERFTYYSPYVMLQYKTPIAIAMEASVEIDGVRTVLGDVWAEAGSRRLDVDFAQNETYKDMSARNIDIRLTPKPDLARRTVDVYEIWGGEYEVGPITIGRIDE